MDRRIAKELLHIEAWLERVDEIVARGKDAYLEDELLQEAGDSLMMKLGEAANRLSRMEARSPAGNRLGSGHRQSQFHHPSIRRNQSLRHLADTVRRPRRVETGASALVQSGAIVTADAL